MTDVRVEPGDQTADQRRRELLAGFLAARHEACPGCEYDLHGLMTLNCPECNQVLRLCIMPREPKMGGWVTGLIALATATGTAALLVVLLALIVAFRTIRPSAWELMLVGVTVTGLLCGLALAAWVRWSGWIRSRGDRPRAGLIASAWLVSAVAMTLMFALLR